MANQRSLSMSQPRPFTIDVPAAAIERIIARVRDYDWHEMPANGGWAYGANLDYMKELCAYWVDGFDWQKAQDGLNRFPQFMARSTIEGEALDIHYLHVPGRGPDPMPLILSHGWPGSFFEFLHVIEPLTDPAKFGGRAEDAFTVVVPSLPGYGFSGKPRNPIGPRRIAAYFATLMTEVLGHERYFAQGGDWGSIISTFMGLGARRGGTQPCHLRGRGRLFPPAGIKAAVAELCHDGQPRRPGGLDC
jgi:hypothetical protein